MEGVTDREIITAAFELGVNFGRLGVLGSMLGDYGLSLTPEMVNKLSDYRHGITLSGYEPFEPITSLEAPPEVHAKFLEGNPKIVIIAQLAELSENDLLERYKLTPEEIGLVKHRFEFGHWRLRPSTPSSSS